MATYTIQDSTLEDIGDAIRLKTGGSSKMTPQQMATAIGNLNPSGGGNVPAGGTTGQVLTKHSDTDFDTEWANGGSGGSTVSVTQVLSSGTKIATVTVDGAGTDIFAPSGGGGGGASIDDTAGAGDTDKAWSADKLVTEFASKQSAPASAPSGSSAQPVLALVNGVPTWVDKVSVSANLSSGTQIAAIRVDGILTRIYAPAGGSIEVVRLA